MDIVAVDDFGIMRRSLALSSAAATLLILSAAATATAASVLHRSLPGIRNPLNTLKETTLALVKPPQPPPPVHANPTKRDTVNCTDLAASFDSSCWDTLQLSEYLLDPTTGWNHTTRTCSSVQSATNQDGSDCCKPNEAWTTCYLRLAHGFPGDDCSQINSQFCSYDHTLNPYMDPAIMPKVQYVMKNIYSLNNFFTTYYTALTAATISAQTCITSLINELDPVASTSFDFIALLTALSVGLAFLGAPSLAVSILGLSTLARTAAQALTISLQQAPGTAKALWPTGTDSSITIQIGDLETELGNSTQQLADMINSAVQLLMSDMVNFVHFAEGGQYSGSQSLSLPAKVDGLDYALRTYMTSEALAQNDWVAGVTLGPYETAADVESSVQGSGGFSCTMGSNNVCYNPDLAAWYWSQTTGRVYSLYNIGPNPRIHPIPAYNLTLDIVNNNWAILEVLFDGSFNCTSAGKFGDSVVNFNWDGTLDIACISQMPIKIVCGTECPSALVNGTCPFETIDGNGKGGSCTL